MARKKKLKTPLFAKIIGIGILLIVMCFVAVNKTRHIFTRMDYFAIQSVVIDPSLPFINKRDLDRIIGKNIFSVDLKLIQRKLDHKYPQASQLKVTRRFPNQILVAAKQRVPFAQIQIHNQVLILDKASVILSFAKKMKKGLPEIVGAKLNNSKFVLGLPLKEADIRTALKTIKLFKADSHFASLSIKEINVENLSKIYFKLSNNLEIIIDRDKIVQKIRVLGVLLSQSQLDLKHVKYIDLRFKEPIIGKK